MVHQARVGDLGRHASGGRGICRFAATPERDREHGARADRVAALPATRRTDHDGPLDAQPGFWRPTRSSWPREDISESAAFCGSVCPARRHNFCHRVFKSMAENDRMPDGDRGAVVTSVDGRSRSGGRGNRKPERDSTATSGIHPQTAGAAKQGKQRGSIAGSPRNMVFYRWPLANHPRTCLGQADRRAPKRPPIKTMPVISRCRPVRHAA